MQVRRVLYWRVLRWILSRAMLTPQDSVSWPGCHGTFTPTMSCFCSEGFCRRTLLVHPYFAERPACGEFARDELSASSYKPILLSVLHTFLQDRGSGRPKEVRHPFQGVRSGRRKPVPCSWHQFQRRRRTPESMRKARMADEIAFHKRSDRHETAFSAMLHKRSTRQVQSSSV